MTGSLAEEVLAPVATIARASGQAGTTGALPITFDISFNVPVTGFDASDIAFEGDASGLDFNITGSGASYQLVVTSVDRSRKVIPTVQASAVTNSLGVANAAAVTADASQLVAHRPVKFKQIVAGARHGCGLSAEGVAYCWGDYTSGQVGNVASQSTASSPIPVDISPLGGESTFIQLSAGGHYTCGITSGGVPYCWGADEWGAATGQLGNGSVLTATQTIPSPVDTTDVVGEKSFIQISAGPYHACGLTSERVPYCWGQDENGKLGNGAALTANQDRPSPVNIATVTGDEKAFVQISAATYHTCGITSKGVAYCWGSDQYGQLGNGAGITVAQSSPSPVDTSTITGAKKTFVYIAAGGFHTCGITAEGAAYCWGYDSTGEVGNGAGITTYRQSPSPVDTSGIGGGAEKTWVQIETGLSHTCGLTSDGVAYCWGWNNVGQVGNGGSMAVNPVSPSAVDISAIPGKATFIQISARWQHSCGLTADGTSYCWGSDEVGQLGNGSTTGWLTGTNLGSPSPVNTSSLVSNNNLAFKQVAQGETHACGLTSDGFVYCWGSDDDGRLGNGTALTDDQLSPSLVDSSPLGSEAAFVQIVAGSNHTCGLASDGAAYCWGSDAAGQLGNGAILSASQASPSLVDISTITGDGKAFVQLAAAGSQTCGITSERVPYCWGMNDLGSFGSGTLATSIETSPVAVDLSTVAGVEKAFIQISVGKEDRACGITSEGVAYCWGAETEGQLGNGGGAAGNEASPSPVDISTIAGLKKAFVQITVGSHNTCGLTAHGAAYCWGNDGSGGVGNGAGITGNRVSPSPVDTSSLGGELTFVQLAAGYETVCGITPKGVAFCWGSDADGRLGNGSGLTVDQVSPVPVDTALFSGDGKFVQLVAGNEQTCGISTEGVAYCWGTDVFGELGNGATLTGNQEAPSAVDLSEL